MATVTLGRGGMEVEPGAASSKGIERPVVQSGYPRALPGQGAMAAGESAELAAQAPELTADPARTTGSGLRGLPPLRAVVALLGSATEPIDRFQFSRNDGDMQAMRGGKLDPMAEEGGIGDAIEPSARAGAGQQDSPDGKAVFSRKHAKEKLGADLVESVAGLVVAGGDANEMTADREQAHGVGDQLRVIVDMLGGAAVENTGIPSVQLRRHGFIQVVDEAGLLIVRRIDRIDAAGPERGQEGLGVGVA